MDLVNVEPADSSRFVDLELGAAVFLPVAGIGSLSVLTAALVDDEELQFSAGCEVPLLVGDEPVEQTVVAVLGQVDDAGARIDRDGLVIEAAHFLVGQWLG